MRNGEQTRENIIRQAAALFNQQGFAGASMSDIMLATGLQKGGIYRHFESKEALALEAFDYAVAQMAGRFGSTLAGREHAIDRLHAVIDVFARLHDDPPVPGGCPMLNTAIESDDGNPALRDRARTAMDGLRTLIRQTVRKGIPRNEVRDDVDGDELATLMISTLEGGAALSRLYGDGVHLQRAADAMRRYLDERVR
ncbi:MAG TPA: TetR/AcrR family transcriptional regulator, partial [Longimicrobium sp.]|nr:TetR/AcrR family transcriptional regulator [Longimicrobium sp.]